MKSWSASWRPHLGRLFLPCVFFLAACQSTPPIQSVGISPLTKVPDASETAASTPTAAQVLPTNSPTPVPPTDTPTAIPPSPTPSYNPFASELPLSEDSFVLPLTTRHITDTQAVVFFELDQPAAGNLYYQPVDLDPPVTYVIPLDAGQTRQQITIDGLTPYTRYRVEVGLDGPGGDVQQPNFQGDAWGSVSFRTISEDQPLRIGVFGDASFGDAASNKLVTLMTTYDMDFAIHTGDVVCNIYDDPGPVEAYAKKFYQTISPLLHQTPLYTVIGNHDYESYADWGDSVFYYYAFPLIPDLAGVNTNLQPDTSQYYAFATHDIQFLMLDTQVLYGISGREEEEAWMKERLADTRYRYTIPVLHVPPYYSGYVHQTDQLAVRYTWAPIFADANVPLALSGHSHHYERSLAGDITYIVTGGGSSVLYAEGEVQPESQIFVRRTHFVYLEIYSDHIDLTAIDLDGEVIDQTTIPLS